MCVFVGSGGFLVEKGGVLVVSWRRKNGLVEKGGVLVEKGGVLVEKGGVLVVSWRPRGEFF